MPIHKPKRESTKAGLGLPNTTKRFERTAKNRGKLTEVWNEMPDGAWHQGDLTIAEPGYTWISDWEAGRPYVVVRFYDLTMRLIGTYIDITKPVRAVDGGFEYDDLYLDVWFVPGRAPELLDENELVEALAAKYISRALAKQARIVARNVMRMVVGG